jgi:prepilin-type N-terminal cleavage/methylation domain-containing protein
MVKHRSLYFWKILKNRKGFTMTEVVVVLSLIGIMTAISVPSYFSWLPKHRLQTSVRQIYDDMQLAKIRAVKDNINTYITFSTVNGTYFVFLDDGTVDGTYTIGETILRNNATLENGVNITAANTCGFNNRGMSTVAGLIQVSLANPTGSMRIDVNTAGNISIVTL